MNHEKCNKNNHSGIFCIKQLINFLSIFFLLTSLQAKAQGILVTIYENAGLQSSTLSNVDVFTFNDFSTGLHTNIVWDSVGSFDQIYVLNANRYGGAMNESTGQRSRFSTVQRSRNIEVSTLTLDNHSSYFGMWWSAGDPANVLTFYNNNELVAQFSTASMFGSANLSSDYYGNPMTGENSSEPYAFINFFGDNQTSWNKIELSTIGGGGFESDNYTSRISTFNPEIDSQEDLGLVIAEVDLTGTTETSDETSTWTFEESITSIANGDFSDTLTWDCNCLPTDSHSINVATDVVLNQNFELLTSSQFKVIEGSSLEISSDKKLSINGALINYGTINGHVSLNGSAEQTPTIGNIKKLEINNSSVEGVKLQQDLTFSGSLLLTNGTLDLNSYSLTVYSSVETSGMILQDQGSVNGDVRFVRKTPNKTGYHYLSSPVNSATLSDVNDDFTLLSLGGDLTSSPFPNIYIYDETNPSTHNTDGWTVPQGLDYPMQPGRGFATYISKNTEIDIIGQPNNGPFDVPLSYTFSGEDPADHPMCPPDGWNLVGNPYPSAINWDLIEKSALFHDGLYMWNPNYNKYAGYINGVATNNGSNRIAPFQGFFVRTDGENDTLKFRNSQRFLDSTDLTRFFRRTEREVFKVAIKMGDDVDEAAIYLSANNVSGYNKDLDAFKMETTSQTSPLLYISDENYAYTIKSVNTDYFSDETVNLSFYAPENQMYQLTKRQFDWGSNRLTPLIRDKYNGFVIDLNQSDYSFESKKGTFGDRFEIFFQTNTAITTTITTAEQEGLNVYLVDNVLRVKSNKQFSSLIITDLMGKTIHHCIKPNTSLYEWQVNSDITTGIYIVQVTSGNTSYAARFLIK
jgi:hypothetical protein